MKSAPLTLVLPLIALGLAAAMLAGVFWGTAAISWPDRWSILLRADTAPRNLSLIVWEWRMPRVLLSGLAGAALALAGVLMQTALRNPLADPYLMGLSSGASAAAVAAIIWLPGGLVEQLGVPLIAFVGALLAFGMTLGFAHRPGRGMTPLIVILAGVAVSLMFQSVTAFLLYFGDPHATRNALGWLMGTAAGSRWGDVPLLATVVVILGIVAMLGRGVLDTLLLGDERAQALGISLPLVRLSIYSAVALLTALTVANLGIVGFVGLIVPHMARLLVGGRHGGLIPVAMLAGAVVLVLVDLACRLLLAPEELPLGVLLALLAAPPFIILLRRVNHAL
ncbi:MAG: iron ABC transporter permease [Natronospirillum sp.]|uniref:FecCD family ABC transporter permease n=1 Tax=Natronospirillum sp. TaxID=2812955 RepID=UPI0025F22F10|nr:iron ABC transporter permease [Natronospirillum sp.]MCH8552627.1 iron ABC transporter permease [Natronospirillum sp.]